MKVLVIGLGTFGNTLCETLVAEGVEVIAVDNNIKNIESIEKDVSMAFLIDAKNQESIDSLPIAEIDYAICCIGDDMQSSLLATLHLKEKGISNVIARAISPHHAKILKAIGADEIIFPEEDLGKRLAQRLANGHVYNYIPLSDNHLIVELKPTEFIIGKTLEELKLRENYNINIVAIKQKIPSLTRDNENIFVEKIIDVPTPKHIVSDVDILVIVGSVPNIERFKEEI